MQFYLCILSLTLFLKDVIRGIMTWKKFPSQSLITLSNTPTITDVWVPRWSNCFENNHIPNLLNDLPEYDKNNIIDNE